MNIYFGKAGPDDSVEDLFQFEGGHYYYRLELQPDQFVIYDTCDRSIPFDYDSAKSLYHAIKYMYHSEHAKRVADEWLSNSIRNIGRMYGIKADGSY